MDPVTAVGLAAGILQFLEVGFEAVSVCREIYRDGSVADHRDTEEITELLHRTAEQLKHPVNGLPAVASSQDKDVIEVAEKCSTTAAELLSELSKLRKGPGDGFRQVVSKSVKVFRRKRYLAETERKLESYRDILNTRILSRLNFRTVLHNEQFETLDESIKNLAVALNEGNNTYARLITDQMVNITRHIDWRYRQMKQEEASRKFRDDFIGSLFYPEMFSRFENITRSHDGTCQWFFESSESWAEIEDHVQAFLSGFHQDIQSSISSSSEEVSIGNSRHASGATSPRSLSESNHGDGQHGSRHHVDSAERSWVRPWDSFEEWLRNDSNSPYWLSGKPGSGKSTLMRYVCANFHAYRQSLESSSPWSTSHDVIVCSFFFWSLGNPIQKNYLGLLKSLLYQIADQWEDSVSIISGPAKSHRSSMLHQWTEERLEEALKLFLSGKPSAMRVCIFLDGLDEYEGNEDNLMTTIRLLSQSPGTKVCASSRPEEIFRQGFADCPHVRLQDLNHQDIFKAASDRLTPALQNRFPDFGSSGLIRDLTFKAQGVFLWAELMTKDIISGARNADTYSELLEKLDRTPDTIDGLYMHMLGRLDASYVHEATIYFHHIIAHDQISFPLTLLHVACSQENVWAEIGQHDTNYFLSSDFQDLCRKLEIRLLTRCAGLVEIDESRLTWINWLYSEDLVDQEENNLSRYLRKVKFIHKTAHDFVETKFKPCDDSNSRTAGILAKAQGYIGVAYLTPILIEPSMAEVLPEPQSDDKWVQGRIALDQGYITAIMTTFWPSTQDLAAMHEAAFQIIDRTYDLLFYLNEKLNGSRYVVSEIYRSPFFTVPSMPYGSPLAHRLDLASFFGRWDYLQHHMSKSSNCMQEDIERAVSSAILGLAQVGGSISYDQANDSAMNWMHGLADILLSYLPKSNNPRMHADTATASIEIGDHLKWAALLVSVSQLMRDFTGYHYNDVSYDNLQQALGLCKKIIKTLMKHDAGVDINMLLSYHLLINVADQEQTRIRITVKETLLAFAKRRRYWDSGIIRDLEGFLCDLGAMDRRIFHSVDSEIVRDDHGSLKVSAGICLTHTQSERLSYAYNHERLREMNILWEVFVGLGKEDTKPTKPDPEVENIVQFWLSQTS